jgi:2-(1,2-epoxy-1,2-dihydrophenyl)acetyl-CoA isomerase
MGGPVDVHTVGGTVEVTLNRPEVLNAMNLDLLRSLAEHLTALAVDDRVGAVVICGAGRAFCAGGDLRWVLTAPRGPAAGLHALASLLHQAIVEIRRMRKPVIAAVNGVAAGAGFSLALACDFRLMARSAVFHQAYTSRGLSIDGGGTFSLPRLVGLARALEIAAFDTPITAEQALTWGLATKLVDDGSTLKEARTLARTLAMRSIHAFGVSKQLLTDSFDTPLETQLERERAALRGCGLHPDGREGLDAFSAKRQPVFAPALDSRR